MADVLLVHGACHGAWCWRDLIPALAALGHTPRAIDLPGHSDDPTPVGKVTLRTYADAILAACATDTVVLGHSMGGYAITAAAEIYPQAMSRLIYLCAYVPEPGVTLAEMRMRAPRHPLLPAIRMADDRRSFTIDPDMAGQLFYNDCPDEAVAYALSRLCAQPLSPNNTALGTTDRACMLPRSYIRCTDDRTIPPEFQVMMTQDWPDEDVYDIPTGHSPFFSDPLQLAQLIDRIVKG